MWEGERVDRKCDSNQRHVKGIRKVCQLTEKCDSYERRVRRCGKAWEGVTILREV